MKHCREDYQQVIVDLREDVVLSDPRMNALVAEIQRRTPLGTAIPKDEPVFLLRAQDPCAADTVRFYAAILESKARDGSDMAFCALARRHAALMDDWPVKKQFPDAPGINETPGSYEQASGQPIPPVGVPPSARELEAQAREDVARVTGFPGVVEVGPGGSDERDEPPQGYDPEHEPNEHRDGE